VTAKCTWWTNAFAAMKGNKMAMWTIFAKLFCTVVNGSSYFYGGNGMIMVMCLGTGVRQLAYREFCSITQELVHRGW